ncbi:hypothetical protein JTE90_007590, partial [Oedothorax gibbosus]
YSSSTAKIADIQNVESKDEEMVLAPGVTIRKEKWLQVISGENVTESRLVRLDALEFWLREHKGKDVGSQSLWSLLSSGLMTQGFGAEAYFTSKFVGTMNSLFNSPNSKVPYSSKPHHRAAKTDSGHLELQ